MSRSGSCTGLRSREANRSDSGWPDCKLAPLPKVTVTCRRLQLEELGLTPLVPPGTRPSGDLLPKLKRFPYELLADFITHQFKPCRVADVGGGKVLLAWLLLELGLAATVVDPQP